MGDQGDFAWQANPLSTKSGCTGALFSLANRAGMKIRACLKNVAAALAMAAHTLRT